MASITSKEQGGSKVFSKLFSRESSAAAPSFRVYYGVASAGSVPFLWESQPGTPKNDAVSAATLPPLTPPPSYYTARHHHKPAAAAANANSGAGKIKHSKPKHQYTSIFSAILPKLILHRRSRSSSSSASGGSPSAASSCSSSSSSAFSSSTASSASFRSVQSPAAACSSMRSRVYAFSAGDAAAADSEDERPPAAPTCFSGVRHESFRAFKGCRVAMTVKSALASVGGHGHGPTAAQKV
ncbi:unnamed protein product [Urochloa decumbens]|uniref:Uncharacterized protein n=1 Tax=Urochloa decumbens TaxID=240449 RepID=A0ABC8ZW81_9POAL